MVVKGDLIMSREQELEAENARLLGIIQRNRTRYVRMVEHVAELDQRVADQVTALREHAEALTEASESLCEAHRHIALLRSQLAAVSRAGFDVYSTWRGPKPGTEEI
jgi:phage host-nuclease inhibitor protein Gam